MQKNGDLFLSSNNNLNNAIKIQKHEKNFIDSVCLLGRLCVERAECRHYPLFQN